MASDQEQWEQFLSGEQGQQNVSETQDVMQALSGSLRQLERNIRHNLVSQEDVFNQLSQLASHLGQGRVAEEVQQTPLQSQVTAITQQLTQLQNELLTTQARVAHVQANTPQQSTATALVPKVKIDLPAKFDGTVSKLRSWCFSVEQYAQIKGLDCFQSAAVATTLLVAKAKVWWEGKCMTGGSQWQLGNLEWPDLKSELEIVFGDPDRDRKLISRF